MIVVRVGLATGGAVTIAGLAVRPGVALLEAVRVHGLPLPGTDGSPRRRLAYLGVLGLMAGAVVLGGLSFGRSRPDHSASVEDPTPTRAEAHRAYFAAGEGGANPRAEHWAFDGCLPTDPSMGLEVP